MKSIQKVLVPTDFSDFAEVAYVHALEIARKFDAKVDLIHIIPTLKYFSESIAKLGVPLDMDGELYPTAQKEAIHRMKEIMDDHFPEEHKGEAICKIDRKPSSRISTYAKEHNYDLIVMPSKGVHRSHLLRGSTTEKVIRQSEVPVFAVDKRLSPKGVRRILLPSDGSETSFAALPLALALAHIYDAEIILYHAIELYGSPLEQGYENPEKSDEENIYQTLIDNMQAALSREGMQQVEIVRGEVNFEDQFVITHGASSHSITFKTVIEKSVSAHAGIEAYAAEHADVVVMATHGHSGFVHMLLGSTTEKVAHYLDIPVLTVKPQLAKA